MIGRGGVFAALRSKMLSALPEGVSGPYRSDATIGDWLATGAYVVTNCTRNTVTIEASEVDYGSKLLIETENFLNHCFEHLHELGCFTNDTRGRSDAWGTVTGYYLGFFSASAFLRLLGMPITFLSREQLRILGQLAGTTTPTQGAFQPLFGQQISATHREIIFSRSEKVHEATWKAVLQELQSMNQDPSISKQPDEADFYDSLCTMAFCTPGIGFDWPSFVRNRANYRPGFAYKLTKNNLRVASAVELWRGAESDNVFSIVRSAHRRCNSAVSDFANHVEMMITVSISLFLLVRALYAELLDRRRIDRRWERQRKNYTQRTELLQTDFAALATTHD